jgi:hypothetical protein
VSFVFHRANSIASGNSPHLKGFRRWIKLRLPAIDKPTPRIRYPQWSNTYTYRSSLAFTRYRHLDYAYVSTSHSAQLRTVERCVVLVDTDDHRLHGLINRVFSYVAGSRPEYKLSVFNDNEEKLARVMGQEHEVHTLTDCHRSGDDHCKREVKSLW